MTEKVKKEKEEKPTPLDRYYACYLCGHYWQATIAISPGTCPQCKREGYVRLF
jgi:rubrerythrin